MSITAACHKSVALAAVLGALSLVSALAQPEPGAKKWDISNFDASKFPPASTESGVTFAKDIEPLFKNSCLHCHGENKPHGGFRVDTKENILKGGHDGAMVVVGDSAKSPLIGAIARVNPRLSMPPHPRRGRGGPPGGTPPPPGPGGDNGPGGPPPGGPGGPPPEGAKTPPPPPPPLTADQVGLVRAWIDQGAN